MTDSRSQPSSAIDPAELWERYLAETTMPSPQGAMAFAADHYSARIDALEDAVEIANQKREFAEFEWNRATEGMKERDARIEALEEALRPFANVTVTLSGEIVGLMREDINRARTALSPSQGDGK